MQQTSAFEAEFWILAISRNKFASESIVIGDQAAP